MSIRKSDFFFRLAHQSENQDNLSQALESIQIVEATRPNRVGACWCSRATELIRLPHPATPDSIYAKYSASALWCWKNAHQPVGLGTQRTSKHAAVHAWP